MLIHVSSTVLDWELRADSWKGVSTDPVAPHSYLSHAEKLLVGSNDMHFLIDVVSNLKRAIDQRVKALSSEYKLKRLFKITKAENNFSTLVELGAIRPKMLGQLFEIRNALEHRFDKPPEAGRCEEYCEFVWYFLRSTDYLAQRVADGVVFADPVQDRYLISIDGSPSNDWHETVSGCLPAEVVYQAERKGTFPIEVSEAQTGAEYKALPDHLDFLRKHVDAHKDNDLRFVGTVTDDIRLVLLRGYFAAI